jgi:alkaline phosphatase
VVTSVPVSHATPAAFVGHNALRDADTALAAEMFERSATDVIMGAGHPWFDRQGRPVAKAGYAWISKATWDKLQAGTAGADADRDGDPDPFTLIESRAAFQALAAGPTPSRVAGIVQIRKTLQEERVLPAPGTTFAPYELPFIETVPTLAEMTAGALNVLDDDPDGFFLMIEGGATDWAAHDGQPGFLVEEEIAFNRAVDEVLAWVDLNSNWGETLVIVVSDHETGYVTGPGSGDTPDGPVWNPVVDHGIGVLPGFEFNLDKHTNTIIPVYAKGDAGRLLRTLVAGTDPVRGAYVDNTDIFRLMRRALGPG